LLIDLNHLFLDERADYVLGTSLLHFVLDLTFSLTLSA